MWLLVSNQAGRVNPPAQGGFFCWYTLTFHLTRSSRTAHPMIAWGTVVTASPDASRRDRTRWRSGTSRRGTRVARVSPLTTRWARPTASRPTRRSAPIHAAFLVKESYNYASKTRDKGSSRRSSDSSRAHHFREEASRLLRAAIEQPTGRAAALQRAAGRATGQVAARPLVRPQRTKSRVSMFVMTRRRFRRPEPTKRFSVRLSGW